MPFKEPSSINLTLISSKLLDEILEALHSYLFDNSGVLLDKLHSKNKEIRFLIDAIRRSPENPRPIYSILRIVRKRYFCFCIVEHPYFDLDVWASYSKVYSASFTPFRRICHRLHFFEGYDDKGKNIISSLKRGKYLEEIEKVNDIIYRGFTTIRPAGVFGIGRTSIKFDDRTPDKCPDIEKHELEKTGIPYCKVEFPQLSNVYSTRLEIKAVPFIQQDPPIGVCAAASIWTASQVLSNRFGLNKFSYDTIAEQALYSHKIPSFPTRKDNVFGPPFSIQNIIDVLSDTGANAIPIYAGELPSCPSPQARFRLLTYTFVESGIPPILCYSRHAVTLFGHLLPAATDGLDSAETKAELTFGPLPYPDRHHLIGQAVQLYYAHNDAYGPFDRIRIFSDAKTRQIKEELKKKYPDNRDVIDKQPCIISQGRLDKNLEPAFALVV